MIIDWSLLNSVSHYPYMGYYRYLTVFKESYTSSKGYNVLRDWMMFHGWSTDRSLSTFHFSSALSPCNSARSSRKNHWKTFKPGHCQPSFGLLKCINHCLFHKTIRVGRTLWCDLDFGIKLVIRSRSVTIFRFPTVIIFFII